MALHSSNSIAKLVASLPISEQKALFRQFSPRERAQLTTYWPFIARPSQVPPPGDWTIFLFLAGRGAGKTRSGAEWLLEQVIATPNMRAALIGPTNSDVRDTMIEGESGLLACARNRGFAVEYKRSMRRIECSNGSRITSFSAEEPERLRGPQHHVFWADEICAWEYDIDTWDMLMFGLRLGQNPRGFVSTTPKPKKLVRDLYKDPSTYVVTGSTYDNLDNLAPLFRKQVLAKYEGTRLGRQEIHAEILEDVPGALWNRANIHANRVDTAPNALFNVLGVDIATTSSKRADLTGIVVAGADFQSKHYYVHEDNSDRYKPAEWAQVAIDKYKEYNCHAIVAEINQGGDLVRELLEQVWTEDYMLPFIGVHASVGKRARAEPITLLYEQNRVHHVGQHELLEDEMVIWDPLETPKSPDRIDALVWALTELYKRLSVFDNMDVDLSSFGQQVSQWPKG